MNCSPTIAIALLLLSLSAGMFLLYKTQKEALGMLFKAAAWFIIVISIGSLICCSVCCVFRCCKQKCGGMEQCGPHEGMSKHVMIYQGGGGECEVECEVEKEGCCLEGEECGEEKEKCLKATGKCCKEEGEEGHEKLDVVKDTVIIKRNTSK